MGNSTKNMQRGDIFSRVNFLYQAAHAALIASPRDLTLTRTYVQSLKAVAEKSVLRLDPSLKRNLCKKCYMLLVPGITCTVRVKSKRQKHVVVRCLDCGTVKRFNLDVSHRLWSQQPEAWFRSVPQYVQVMNNAQPAHEELQQLAPTSHLK
ncbi:hypothetical protein LSH36_6g05074 [Paralvinella palmiformis]|uniref:Uncharacterized protein n=1 Tax=Paralvinella palmiformis TaxID=53620 RepID=A0AAD9KEV4_9ANNE|nr:hypothetical protein LSH36_6g05074 [Paralvinella palmiformis]